VPNYKGHLYGGIVAYALLLSILYASYHPSMTTALEWLLATLAGALFPDIDTKSKGQKYFYSLIFVLFILLALRQRFEIIAACSFIILSPLLVHHRGIFHHPLFLIIVPLVLWGFASTFLAPSLSQRLLYDVLFFILGALSHIWLDLGTRQFVSGLLGRKKKRW
jgi:hypothetical protein